MSAETAHSRRQLLRMPELAGTMVRVLGGALAHSINIIDNPAFLDAQRRLKNFSCANVTESKPRLVRDAVSPRRTRLRKA